MLNLKKLAICTSRICFNAHKTMVSSRGWQWDRNAFSVIIFKRIFFKRNQYLISISKSEEDYSHIFLTLMSIFSQNIDEFEKQVETLESVHPLISKCRQAGKKKLGFALCFQPACLYLEIRGRTLSRVWTITSYPASVSNHCSCQTNKIWSKIGKCLLTPL